MQEPFSIFLIAMTHFLIVQEKPRTTGLGLFLLDVDLENVFRDECHSRSRAGHSGGASLPSSYAL
jgi:hypothetical protein